MREALDLLAGDAELHFLGLPDGALATTGDAVARAVQPWSAGVTHLVSPLRGTGTRTTTTARAWPPSSPSGSAPSTGPTRSGCGTGATRTGACWTSPSCTSCRSGRTSARPSGLRWPHTARSTPRCPGSRATRRSCRRTCWPTSAATSRPSVSGPPHRPRATAYFDALYAADADPWGLADRFYERRKRDLLLASLPRQRSARAFEPGCSGGWLTERLAARCDRVVAWDASEAAVASARERVPGTVDLAVGRIPEQWPAGELDLVVLSEIAYYCPDLDRLVERIDASLTADGVVVACHWRHPAPDHPHTADEVHQALRARFAGVATHVERDFVLDVLTRDGRSVAQAEGIV